MITPDTNVPENEILRLRLETLIRIRWLAITGQTITVIYVGYILNFEFYVSLCLAVIACSVWLNIFLRLRYSANFRISENATSSLLIFDLLQLALLLYLTGGLRNPFSILLMVPVIISASTQSYRQILLLGALAITLITLLAIYYLPVPWFPGEQLVISQLFVVGVWIAIMAGLVFTSIYAFRVADEGRKLSNALTATELILQREQYLFSLDGLAAAAAHELGTPLATIALVSKEMSRELPKDSPLMEDALLLRSQATRCRDILQKLTSLSDEGEEHIGKLSLPSLMDEVAEPHRNFGITLNVKLQNHAEDGLDKPVFIRNPGVLYGLGNLMENAVDFARTRVEFIGYWDDDFVSITILDNGDGFPKDIQDRIGEPYISKRKKKIDRTGGGLGLGLFIGKTLLERSGATLDFSRGKLPSMNGAQIVITWQRQYLKLQHEAYDNRKNELSSN